MRSGWNGTRRPATVAAVGATAVLVAAAAIVGASASGVLHPHTADAATTPATSTPASTTPATTTPATTMPRPRHRAHAKPRRHGPRTALTHLPAAVADGTVGVAIRLNGTPAPDTPRPSIAPHVAGSWRNMGPYERFRPASTLAPCTTYELRIPARTFVLRHRTLGAPRVISFHVACPGITALQEALARLNYLPYALRGYVGASSVAPLTRRAAARRAFMLPRGVLRPNVHGAPPLSVGTLDPTTTGAIEVFEQAHGLPLGTTVTKALWVNLLASEALAHRNPRPYTWVTVTKTIPETLEVHQDAKVVLTTPTNTGVPGADTQAGVFPIYLRYVATTMIGTNVDGSHYNDPGVPWVNYFNGGDAVHGYIRPSYGTPQSNGCVELPISTAQTVYGMLELGDLVMVE